MPVPRAAELDLPLSAIAPGVGIRGLHQRPTRLLVCARLCTCADLSQLLGSISAALGTAFMLARVPIASVEELWAVPW